MCGVLDGSNVRDVPPPVVAAAPPAPAPVPASPPVPLPASGYAARVDAATAELVLRGEWRNDDGKIRVVFDRLAYADPGIDHASMDGFIRESMSITPARTFSGAIGMDGRFTARSTTLASVSSVLIVVSEKYRSNPGFISRALANELRHAEGLLSGEYNSLYVDIQKIMTAASGSDDQKASLGIQIPVLTIETRATMAQLEYFLSRSEGLSPRQSGKQIASTVEVINLMIGYKNFIYGAHDLALKGSRDEFNNSIERIYARIIPSEMIDSLNAKLEIRGTVVLDKNFRNTPEQNHEVFNQLSGSGR